MWCITLYIWQIMKPNVLCIFPAVQAEPQMEGAHMPEVNLPQTDDSALIPVPDRRGMAGVDVCACCSNDQISICCVACMSRARGKQDVSKDKPVISQYNQGTQTKTSLLAPRFNILRRSACRCCVWSSSPNSRCCHWCTTMRMLSQH